MKKAYVEVVRLNVTDVITTSAVLCPEDSMGGTVCDDD